MPDITLPLLYPSELPLLLLAAAAHPDDEVRTRLAWRLDLAIEEQAPHHSERACRAFFRRQDRHRRAGVRLAAPLREIAVRVTRLAFSGTSAGMRRKLLIGHDARTVAAGYVVDANLKAIYLGGCSLTRHRQTRQQPDCRFLAGQARARLEQIHRGEPLVRAVCRVEDRPVLDLEGELPFSPETIVLWRSRLGSAGLLGPLGFKQLWHGKSLRLFPDTPEAILRFSASLMRGELLHVVPGRHGQGHGRVIVRLHDFDGDHKVLPSLASTNRVETWLHGVTEPALRLSDEDRLAIARWAWPIDAWMTTELMEKLF
jgi:hypothetical protein